MKSAYITCALWASTGTVSEEDLQLEAFADSGLEVGDDYELDRYFGESDLSDECREQMEADCTAFIAYCEAEGIELPEDDTQNGHDFWLSRNGHGAGFWDRGYENGDALHAAAKTFGECDLYVGDDGKIYC